MRSRTLACAGIGALAILSTTLTPALAATNAVTLTNGAELSVTLNDPADQLLAEGAVDVDVPVSGSAAIGKGTPTVHWTYIVDVSGSTADRCGSSPDAILDCEKQAVVNLNNFVADQDSSLDVGLTVFGTSGAAADMQDASGDQPLTSATDPGVNTVINSITYGKVGAFTSKNVGDGSTNFAAALHAALASVGTTTAAKKNVVFMSDGQSNLGGGAFGSGLTQLVNAGATIHAFAVGSGATCTGGSDGTLQQMANATGGTCTNVTDPAHLPGIVQDLAATELKSVSLTGATLGTALGLPLSGPASTNFTGTAKNAAAGAHEVCASATGTGPASVASSEQTVQACESFNVYGFALTPETADNELGVDQQHTVTATLTGPAGALEGHQVAFAVTGQNAGATGTCAPTACTTDADGTVTFTYNVPKASSSLGTDTITADITVGDLEGTRSVKKNWIDTTPPVVTCVQGPNPGGRIPAAPGRGGQAQNPDGFYTLAATDDVWTAADLELFVTDDGSGHVFGAFANPTNIKYTEANGAQPSQKAGSGAVAWQLRGQGDAQLHAVDGSGNASASIACRVPNAPQ